MQPVPYQEPSTVQPENVPFSTKVSRFLGEILTKYGEDIVRKTFNTFISMLKFIYFYTSQIINQVLSK